MSSPESLERLFTLLTATARHHELWSRHVLADDPSITRLSCDETLELLALGELIARKASYGRQLAVRAARASGASWSQIGEALGMSKQSAWEAHTRWMDEQSAGSR